MYNIHGLPVSCYMFYNKRNSMDNNEAGKLQYKIGRFNRELYAHLE